VVWGVVVHGAAAEIQQMSWCRVQSGAEVVQRWCRGFTFYQRCREVLQRCRGAGGRGAEVQRFGCGAGAGAGVQVCRCRGVQAQRYRCRGAARWCT